jgi:cardiolipin synthase A/B
MVQVMTWCNLRILVPEKSNHPMVDLARGTYLRELQAAGGKIQLYTKGMMHAKVMIVDDELVMLGSANMDMRSLFLNYETAMFAYSQTEIRAAETWVEELFIHSRAGVTEVGAFRDICEGVVRIMAPLL